MPESHNSFCFELVQVERRKVREGISYAKLTSPSKSSFELNPKLILVFLSESKSKPKNTQSEQLREINVKERKENYSFCAYLDTCLQSEQSLTML